MRAACARLNLVQSIEVHTPRTCRQTHDLEQQTNKTVMMKATTKTSAQNLEGRNRKIKEERTLETSR